MMHEMRLQPGPFERIRSGEKTIEYRLFDEKRQTIRIGDEIAFTNRANNQSMHAEIITLERFVTFAEAAQKHGYDPTQFNTAMRAHYSLAEEQRYGVLAIHLRLRKQTE